MKVGDIIEVLEDSFSFHFEKGRYFKKGNMGKLVRKDSGGGWWADFSIDENYITPECGPVRCLEFTEFRVVKES